ncbi:MAG: beta-galactosidase [Phycisphaerales bacterium]
MSSTRSRLDIVAFIVLAATTTAWAGDKTVVVHPQDTGEALANPGMGWVLHHYDNVAFHYGGKLEPSDTVDDFPGVTAVYLRIAWSHIEPEEGRFNWSVLDTPAQRWLDKGKQIALRISCSESFMRYATPQWVEKAGAKGYNFTPRKGVDPNGPYWEPDYDDPVFIEKLDHFLAALARRYDGNPEVAFIDVGSVGVWGEGHTFASTRLPYSAETIRRHIDLHTKHFKKTLLAANDDFALQDRGRGTIEYAAQQGLGLRDDSILVQGGDKAYFNADFAPLFWEHVPVVLESEHFGPSRDRGNWKDGSQYLEAIEKYHASYASIHWWPREFLAENRDLVRRINLRLGYRLQLVEASWPGEIPVDGSFWFATTWQNAGVAPCLPGGHPAITLKDAKGGIAAVFVDEGMDARGLRVAEPGRAPPESHKADFGLPLVTDEQTRPLKPGTYEVYISIGARTGTPRIALPLPNDDGHRRYRIGKLTVLPTSPQ